MERRRRAALVVVALACGFLVQAPSPARAVVDFSSFSFVSDPGDYVGGGGSGTLTSDDVTFTSHGTAGRSDIRLTGTAGWTIRLSAPAGAQLAPGTYTGAERFSGVGRPGLDVTGYGRGCSATFGSFTVRSISSDASGRVVLLDASFEQHCETPGAPALRGTLRYRAPAPAPVVATSSNPATVDGQPVTFTAVVDAGAGGAPTGKVKFREGTTVLGSAPVTNGLASFTTDDLAVGTHRVTAHYSGDATHAAARSAAVEQTVREGKTSLWFASPSDDPVGRGATASYTPDSATIAVAGDAAEVTAYVDTPEGMVTARFAAPVGDVLEPGRYEDAERAAFRTGARPGLDVSGFGSGCNLVSGSFEVHALGRDADGNVLLLDVSFSQSCETTRSPLVGRVRYYASTRTELSVPWLGLTYGAEDALPFEVEVTSLQPGTPAGTVALETEHGAPVCTATLSGGAGSCTLGATQLLPGTYLVFATYTPTTPGLEASTSAGRALWVNKAGTHLAVDQVRGVDVATTGQVTYRAVLTSRVTGGALAGEVVAFTPNSPFGLGGGVGGCQAVTDAGGVATCSVDAAVAGGVVLGFTASYAGSATYHPTNGSGSVTAA